MIHLPAIPAIPAIPVKTVNSKSSAVIADDAGIDIGSAPGGWFKIINTHYRYLVKVGSECDVGDAIIRMMELTDNADASRRAASANGLPLVGHG